MGLPAKVLFHQNPQGDPCKLKSYGTSRGWQQRQEKRNDRRSGARRRRWAPLSGNGMNLVLPAVSCEKENLTRCISLSHLPQREVRQIFGGESLGENDGVRISEIRSVSRKNTVGSANPWLFQSRNSLGWLGGGWGRPSFHTDQTSPLRSVWVTFLFYFLFLPVAWDLTLLLIIFSERSGKF